MLTSGISPWSRGACSGIWWYRYIFRRASTPCNWGVCSILSCWEGRGVGLGCSAIQFFVVWIAMQFLHACRLSLFLQFQAMGWTSHREVPASRAKGSTDMDPRGWQSKRVKPTSLAELQHLVVPTRSKSQHAQGEQSPVRDWSHEDDLSHAEEETPPPYP